MDEDNCLVEQFEIKNDSKICIHFTGDKLDKYHISKCFRHCSYCDAKGMMQSEEPLKRVHNRLKQR